jgi:hypothetical protein
VAAARIEGAISRFCSRFSASERAVGVRMRKAMGLAVPDSLLARADEVIE